MAALAAAIKLRTRNRGRHFYLVTNAQRVYSGALVGVLSGAAVPWTSAVDGREFLGIAINVARDELTNTHSVLGNGTTVRVEVDTSGRVMERISVAGGASAGQLVYSADDDANNSLTVAVSGRPIGRVIKLSQAALGLYDVRLFQEEEARLN